MSVVLFSSEHCEGESVPCLFPSFCWFAVAIWCSSACITLISAFVFRGYSPYVCISLWVNISPFSRTQVLLD